MRQECPLAVVWASFAIIVASAIVVGVLWGPLAGVAAAAWGGLAWFAYVRYFPLVSRWIGYGSVVDASPLALPDASGVVRLYTAVGCPFCPIVRSRLAALARQMGFRVEEVDVTWRPSILAAKGLRAVPVVEAGSARIVGHATSDALARLVAGARTTPPLAPVP